MAFSLLWLPEVLLQAGLKVALIDGWENRGTREMGRVVGVICHHTAGAKANNMPSLQLLIDGRPGLSGPLAQLGLGRDGTYYVVAAGSCNHAGPGIWKGFVNGNANFIGIEAENTGLPNDLPWPAVQMEAYRRGVAAILKHVGQSAAFCAGHKEYRLPPNTKNDPSFDMVIFRSQVDDILNDRVPALAPIPATEPGPAKRPTLRRGSSHQNQVRQVQRMIGLTEDGVFGSKTEAAVRVFQRQQGAVPDGIVGPKTWALLDASL